MKTRILPAGDAALLVEVDGVEAVLALTAALRVVASADIVDLVPAATTVLVLTSPGNDLGELGATVARIAEGLDPGEDPAPDGEEVRIRVRYDGPDLDEVAELTGLNRSEVIARHTGAPWRAAFGGFAPGFAYLVGGDPALDVPRRHESRTTVPAGAVALAGGYSAVYPAESPGGWQLIGTTDARLWDVDRDPPALIRPGTVVRFVDAGSGSDAADPTDSGEDDREGTSLDGATRSTDSGHGTASVAPFLEVLRTGPLSLFQDAGRPGNASIGVGTSGAADSSSYLSANRLVGNDDGAAVIESVLGGLAVRAGGDVVVAVTGAQVPVTVDGEPADHGAPLELRDGQQLKLGTAKQGLRSYLAVRGGFDVPVVLGSCGTDTLSGVGPPAIARGDRIGVRTPGSDEHRSALDTAKDAETRPDADPPPGPLTLRVIAGPRDDWFSSPSDLAVGEWVVSPNSNRVGVRLDRPGDAEAAPALRRNDSRELPSEGVTLGAIQVPPSGQPVLFLADHPVTGGYPVIAVVVTADVDRAAQARPGQRISFAFQPPEPAPAD
ncbi:5-oxoprolinase subunit B/C family protein [Nakamurella sp. GG22]